MDVHGRPSVTCLADDPFSTQSMGSSEKVYLFIFIFHYLNRLRIFQNGSSVSLGFFSVSMYKNCVSKVYISSHVLPSTAWRNQAVLSTHCLGIPSAKHLNLLVEGMFHLQLNMQVNIRATKFPTLCQALDFSQ